MPKEKIYRGEIDGLRAIAVLGVIIYHFKRELLPNGYLGVDIFFVISGYLVTSSLLNLKIFTFKNYLITFYQRRLKRLLPALIFFVITNSLIISLFNPSSGLAIKTGITSLLGISNLYLLKISTDYFSQLTELNPFVHTWSLSVEIQFYIIFPLLIWFLDTKQYLSKNTRIIIYILLGISIISLKSFIFLYDKAEPSAYFLMPTRLWEITLGSLIFISQYKKIKFIKIFKIIPVYLLIISILIIFFIPYSAARLLTVSIVLITSILLMILKKGTKTYNFLTLKPLRFLGKISYSLYLWHWGILSLGRWTIGNYSWSIFLQIILLILVSTFSYFYIEKPFSESSQFFKSFNYILKSLLAVFFSILYLLGIWRLIGNKIYLGKIYKIEKEFKEIKFFENCNLYKNTKDSVNLSEKCGAIIYKDKPTIYLLGDSHAQQFNNSIKEFASKRHINVKTIWGNSCLFPSAIIRAKDKFCFDKQLQIENKLLDIIKKEDIVIFANALYLRFNSEWDKTLNQYYLPSMKKININKASQIYSQRIIELSNQLVKKKAKIIIYLDGVQFIDLEGPGNFCRQEWFRRSIEESCQTKFTDYKKEINKRFYWTSSWQDNKNRFLWDASKYQKSCKEDICTAKFYSDGNHFTPYYSNYIFNSFIKDNPNLFRF